MTQEAPGDRPSEGFPPERRLRERRLFVAAYEEGRKAHGRLIVLVARRRSEEGGWRLGLTATRKVGKAVVRNRLRRLGREVFRRMGGALPEGWDFVLNFKRPAVDAGYEALRADVATALARLRLERSDEAETGGAPRAD